MAVPRRAGRAGRLPRARARSKAERGAQPDLRYQPSRRGRRFRRLRLACDRGHDARSAPLSRPVVVRLVPAQGHDPGAARNVRPHWVDGDIRDRRGRLRRDLARRQPAPRPRRGGGSADQGMERAEPRRTRTRRETRATVPARGVRDQRASLRPARQLRVDSFGDAVVLQAGPGGRGAARHGRDRAARSRTRRHRVRGREDREDRWRLPVHRRADLDPRRGLLALQRSQRERDLPLDPRRPGLRVPDQERVHRR